jgi:hypothetical protein
MFIITGFKNHKKKHQTEQNINNIKAIEIAKKYEIDCDYAIVMDDNTANIVYITNKK